MNSSNKLVLFTTLLTLSVAITAASPADLSIFPQESSARIDSFTSYEVTVENTGPVMDSYSLSSTHPSEVTIAPTDLELEPGESEVVNVWYNPETDREAGRYSFNIKAQSRATSKTYSVEGIVNVIREHDISVSVDSSRTACLGERATYDVKLTNNGIQKEEFELSSQMGTFSRERVTLEDGETATVELHVSSDEAVNESFNVVAASTTSYAQDIQSTSFQAEVCYASDVVISPGSQRIAAGDVATYDVTVRNQGTKADEFVIKTNRGKVVDSKLEIPGKSSKTTQVELTPASLGEQTVRITASSEVKTTETATLNVYNGMDVGLAKAKETVRACENSEASTQIQVENTGEARETFNLQTNEGSLDREKVTLSPGQTRNVGLTYNATDPERVQYEVTATANSFGEPQETVEGNFQIENCYDLKMSIIPEVASAGENMSQVYEVKLENPGTRTNTYELTYEGPSWISIKDRESDDNEHTVTVPAGETGYADIYAGIPFQKKGNVEITATAVGDGDVKKSKTVTLVIGEEIEEAMKSNRGGTGLITGSFSKAANGLVNAVQSQGVLVRLLFAMIVAVLLAAVILYREG